MKKYLFSSRTIPFAFLLLCLIAYGLFIPWLGFFWDDWVYTWFAHTLGPRGLINALVNDRVFLAGIYAVTTNLLGSNPLVWQIFAILTRWLSVLALWWSLRQVWPQRLRQVTWVALLFAVYPGFLQHWISVIYSQAYLLLAATLFSLGLTIYAMRTPRRKLFWPLTLAAVLLSVISLFSTEYFFGLELLRPLLIWFVLAENEPRLKARATRTLVQWLPYLGELIFFVIWRTFLFHSEGYQVQAVGEMSANLLGTIKGFFQAVIANSFTGGLAAWAQAFNAPHALDFATRTTQFYWIVAAASLVLLLVYLMRLSYRPAGGEAEDPEPVSRWPLQAMAAGVLALFAAVIPFWAANLPFNLNFPYNRFTLAMMMGSSLLIVGLLEFFIRTARQKVVLLSILLAMAIAFQFQTANTFRRDFEAMRSFIWQLSWRMPGLKPGTELLTYELPFAYYSDNSLSAPLNLLYAPDNHSTQMPYILNYLRTRLKGAVPNLDKGTPLNIRFRAMQFKGSTSDSIVFHFSPSGCVLVLDPVYTNSGVPELHSLLEQAIPLSNLNQIITHPAAPASPPRSLFGKENTNTWCYYFEKADLARQTGDWETVVHLYEQAQAQHLHSAFLEWEPFIEGYAHMGELKKARSMTEVAVKNRPELATGLCQLWNRVQQETNPSPAEQQMIQEIKTGMECKP